MFKILNADPANGKSASKMNTHARDLKATRHEGSAENSVLPACRVSSVFCTCGRACARVHYTRSFVTCRNYISFALAIQASKTANLRSSLVRRKTRNKLEIKLNRPFPNYLWPLFQSESWCSSFHMKISFHLHVNEN